MNIVQIDIKLRQLMDSFRPGERIGVVHSRFDHTVNILTADGSHFITLADPSTAQSPFMMRAQWPTEWMAFRASVQVGDPAFSLSSSKLGIGSQIIDAAAAEHWESILGSSETPEQIFDRLRLLSQWLEETDPPPGLLAVLKQKCSQETASPGWFFGEELGRRVRMLREGYSEDRVRQLAGLGLGLTPSGDDFITGLWAALLHHGSPNMSAVVEQKQEWDRYFQNRTTTISRFVLKYCMEGNVNDRLRRLLSADAADIGPRRDELLGLGSTSGADMLAGVMTGYDFLIREQTAFERRNKSDTKSGDTQKHLL